MILLFLDVMEFLKNKIINKSLTHVGMLQDVIIKMMRSLPETLIQIL